MAVLLLDENQAEAAKEYIDDAQKGSLYVEEKKLLKEAMAKAAGIAQPAFEPSSPTSPPSPSPTPTAADSPH